MGSGWSGTSAWFSYPQAKVLLTIFPCGERPDAQRAECAEASRLAFAAFAGDEHMLCNNIGKRFLGAGGVIAKEVMPDFLCLTTTALRTWVEAIVDDVGALLK
jgi:hypothetical protein